MSTTYTVTITTVNETFREVDKARLARMRKNYGTKNIKAVAEQAPKFWYYRGERVVIHEERQNGYTMVSSADGTGKYAWAYATTAELEYR